MKGPAWFWNVVHYTIFLSFTNLYTIMNFINPFWYISKISSVKRFYQNRGVYDIQKQTKSAFNNPKTGINSIHSVGLAGGLIIFFTIGILDYCKLTPFIIDWTFRSNANLILTLLILILPPIAINYLALYRNNIYLDYFEEFNMWSTTQRRKYLWLGAITIVFILVFFAVSIKFMK
jgi:hypothetical protein